MKQMQCIVIGACLGWLSIWGPGPVDAVTAMLLAAIAASAAISIARKSDAGAIPLALTAYFAVGLVVGVIIGAAPLPLRVTWAATGLTRCELARASFGRTFTLPENPPVCPDREKGASIGTPTLRTGLRQ
jgi:hypothetical protein